MKSHDCHVFMQDLLLPTFQGILPKEVFEPLAELSLFFKQLCSKTLRIDVLEKMEKSIAITLCKLEKVFVPSFFDIMIHLPIHLAREAILAGPVQSRWQYRFEREMNTMKPTVHNKAHPEASMAQARIAEECFALCSMYLSGLNTKFNRIGRNDMDRDQSSSFMLSIFQNNGNPMGKRTFKKLSHMDWKQAQLYVLMNCPEVQTFIKEYAETYELTQNLVDRFKSRIWKLHKEKDPRISPELLSLSRGASKSFGSFQGYYVNGYRFHTKKRQRRRKTQNSGIVVKGDEETGQRDFLGVLKEVLELEYGVPNGGEKPPIVVLFRFVWFDVYNDGRGIKTDKFGITRVNVKRMMNPDANITSEPSAKKKREGPFRGPSRALKYKKLRQAQPGKVKVEIPSSSGAAVGDHALQFVGECSDWVKDFCPVNVYKWSDMPENILDELYGKIKSKFDLGEGAHIEPALKTQCSSLYRHWRERLKKKKFSKCKSLKEVERACPEDINIDQWKWLVYT